MNYTLWWTARLRKTTRDKFALYSQRRLHKDIIGSSRKLTWIFILTFVEDVVDEAHLIITNLPDQIWNC